MLRRHIEFAFLCLSALIILCCFPVLASCVIVVLVFVCMSLCTPISSSCILSFICMSSVHIV
jgi:hypothetical protein